MGAARAFKQLDVTRAFKAAKAAGIEHPRVRILPGGALEIDDIHLTADQVVAPAEDLDAG